MKIRKSTLWFFVVMLFASALMLLYILFNGDNMMRGTSDIDMKTDHITITTRKNIISNVADTALPEVNVEEPVYNVDKPWEERNKTHDISFEIENFGKTAVKTRMKMEISAENANGELVDPSDINIYLGISPLSNKTYICGDKEYRSRNDIPSNTPVTAICYSYEQDTFDGVGAESEKPENSGVKESNGRSFKKYTYQVEVPDSIFNTLDSTTMSFKVSIEGKHYGSSDSWSVISEGVLSAGGKNIQR